MQLPSPRRLIGTSIRDDELGWHKAAPNPSAYGVTDMTFHDSVICASSFSDLLEGTKLLKRFTYNHSHWVDNFGLGSESSRVIDRLRKHASCSLEYLALTGATRRGFQRNTGSGRGRLRYFEGRKEVRFPSNLYFEPEENDKSSDTKANHLDCEEQKTRLVSFLPESIEKVELDNRVTMNDVDSLLAGLDSCKAEDVPKLKKIFFHSKLTKNQSSGQQIYGSSDVGKWA